MTSDILQPGTLVADRYRIDRLIGSGGFARVYKAIELGLEREVALKILSTKLEGTADHSPVRARFMREAQLISRLRDPRTVTIYGYDSTDDGLLYMALEYVDGVDLRVLMDTEGALPPERVQRLVEQVLLGLREAHVQDCLHRDIKPSNIMVYNRFGERDCVKLLDFGIAKAVLAEHKLGENLTREGGVIGTPGYMSPEQLMGRPLTPATDLFSLGVVAYEMYAGRSPYPSRDATEIHRRMQTFDEDLGELESAPEPLLSVCRRMLQPDVQERAESAEELLAMLRGGALEYGASAIAPASDPAATISGARLSAAQRTASVTTFPLGLDPEGGTPSTELTAVSMPLATLSSAPESDPEPNESSARPMRQSSLGRRLPVRALLALAVVAVVAVGLAVVVSRSQQPVSQPNSQTPPAVDDEIVVAPNPSLEVAAGQGETNSDEKSRPAANPRAAPPPVTPELVEALATARAQIQLGTKIAVRDARERGAEPGEARTTKKREPPARQKRRKEPEEKPRESDESFRIEPFE